MKPSDFTGNSASTVLMEVLQGDYVDLQKNIQITEEGAHLYIDDQDGGWSLTLRRIPKQSVDSDVEALTTA